MTHQVLITSTKPLFMGTHCIYFLKEINILNLVGGTLDFCSSQDHMTSVEVMRPALEQKSTVPTKRSTNLKCKI